MSNFAAKLKAPTTLSAADQAQLLKVSGAHVAGFRDHVIFTLALGAGLREHEIAALDVDDVWDGSAVRRRVLLRTFKGCARAAEDVQEVILGESLRRKIAKYLDTSPVFKGLALFPSRQSARISKRQLRHVFQVWQERAQLERRYRFHDLRHTFCSNLFRQSGKNLLVVKQQARHKRLETTVGYTHPTDDEVTTATNRLDV